MSCKYAKYEVDEGRYYCNVTGDQCIYLVPNRSKCESDGYDEEFEEIDYEEQ